MSQLVYGTGALIAAESGDRRLWAMHGRALAREVRPVVPAGVVTEAWRGNSPNLARLLSGVEVEVLIDQRARAAGALLARVASHVEAVDAMVVECALRRAATIATGNRGHLLALASSQSRRLDIIDL